jgi:hypothetical protein
MVREGVEGESMKLLDGPDGRFVVIHVARFFVAGRRFLGWLGEELGDREILAQ